MRSRSPLRLKTQVGNERLAAEVKQLESKLNMLSPDTIGARCPLCETELGEDGLERVRKSYQTERTEKMHSIKANTEQVQEHSVQRRTLEAEIARIEPALKSDKADRQSQLGKLLNELAAAREAVAATTEDGDLLTTLEERLAARDFATAEQKALAELQAQVASLAYDAGLHEQVRRRLQEASAFQRKWITLDDALRRLPQARLESRQADDAVASLRQQSVGSAKNAGLGSKPRSCPTWPAYHRGKESLRKHGEQRKDTPRETGGSAGKAAPRPGTGERANNQG